MDRFLDDERKLGTEDSEGSFTLSVDKALQKTAISTLEDANDWLVKLVQAILASSPSGGIKISFGRSFTELHFRLDDSWDLDDIATSFSSLKPSEERAYRHLQAGLLQLGKAQRRPFLLESPSHCQKLIWNGERFSKDAPISLGRSKKGSWRIAVNHLSLEAERKLNWLDKIQGRKSVHLPAQPHLRKSLIVAKSRIYLDGQLLKGGLKSYLSECRLSVLHSESNDDFHDLLAAETKETQAVPTIRKQAEQGQLVGAVLLTIFDSDYREITSKSEPEFSLRRDSSYCLWHVDGVIVGRESFPVRDSMVSVQALVDASELATDAGSFSLIESEAKEKHLKKATEEVREAVKRLSDAPVSVYSTQKNYSRILDRGLVAMLGQSGGALAALAIKANPWLLAISCVGGGLFGAKAHSLLTLSDKVKSEPEKLTSARLDCRAAWGCSSARNT